jgi:hypothetical protein
MSKIENIIRTKTPDEVGITILIEGEHVHRARARTRARTTDETCYAASNAPRLSRRDRRDGLHPLRPSGRFQPQEFGQEVRSERGVRPDPACAGDGVRARRNREMSSKVPLSSSSTHPVGATPMRDETRTVLSGPTKLYVHWCSVPSCRVWGGFGFSNNRGEPQWWCWEHYPHKANQVRSEAAEIAEMLR